MEGGNNEGISTEDDQPIVETGPVAENFPGSRWSGPFEEPDLRTAEQIEADEKEGKLWSPKAFWSDGKGEFKDVEASGDVVGRYQDAPPDWDKDKNQVDPNWTGEGLERKE